MENGLKTRLSRIFRGSLNSCGGRDLKDVNETAVLIPQNQPNNLPPFKPLLNNYCYYNINSFPSMCKPRYCTEKLNTKPPINNSIIPRRNLYYFFAEEGGFTCPPASPHEEEITTKKNKKKNKNKKKHGKRTSTQVRRSSEASLFSSSSQHSAYYNWFSSDEEEKETEEEEKYTVFFSSRSATFSSDSSGIVTSKRHRSAWRRRRRSSRAKTDIPLPCLNPEVGLKVMPLNKGVPDSFAVVKTSSDPYNDFRSSMVEMIVERQIFGTKELENLLKCFLALNSEHHHRIIVDAFAEILKALFSS